MIHCVLIVVLPLIANALLLLGKSGQFQRAETFLIALFCLFVTPPLMVWLLIKFIKKDHGIKYFWPAWVIAIFLFVIAFKLMRS